MNDSTERLESKFRRQLMIAIIKKKITINN